MMTQQHDKVTLERAIAHPDSLTENSVYLHGAIPLKKGQIKPLTRKIYRESGSDKATFSPSISWLSERESLPAETIATFQKLGALPNPLPIRFTNRTDPKFHLFSTFHDRKASPATVAACFDFEFGNGVPDEEV